MAARGRDAEPIAGVRGGHESLLADALRADHDLGQGEVDVRKGGEQAVVELRRSGMAFPALFPGRDLVDAVLGERRDQAGEGAVLLGDRVTLPELADLAVKRCVHLAAKLLASAIAYRARRQSQVGHEASLHLRPWISTSCSSGPPAPCRPPS